MERIQKEYGALIMDGGRIFGIEGEMSDNGYIYKDAGAFESGEGICYIPEFDLSDLQEELTNLHAVYENNEPGDEDYITDEAYRKERERIILNYPGVETRQSIIDQVRAEFGDDYLLTDKQVEYFALDVFELADWASICTYLMENFDMDDCILFDEITGRGMFTELQHEAVKQGVYPAELKGTQSSTLAQ